MSQQSSKNRSFYEILKEKMTPLEASTDSVKNCTKTSIFLSRNEFCVDFILNFRAKMPSSSASTHSKPIVKPSEKCYPIDKLSAVSQLALLQLELPGIDKMTYIRVSQIKRQYRRLARRHHPDLNPLADGQHFSELKDMVSLILDELTKLSSINASYGT
ncbi:MAG: hypothetical protein A2Z20_08500 [Bdellovibrionales bacterium RBG_16_40_8]|nr:MAG: hypothetical protein A2Z20_08500 [Bdellovibrionales bacterium RBG_16_40_8]